MTFLSSVPFSGKYQELKSSLLRVASWLGMEIGKALGLLPFPFISRRPNSCSSQNICFYKVPFLVQVAQQLQDLHKCCLAQAVGEFLATAQMRFVLELLEEAALLLHGNGQDNTMLRASEFPAQYQ